MSNNDVWKNPEVIKLLDDIQKLESTIDKRVKENRIEL